MTLFPTQMRSSHRKIQKQSDDPFDIIEKRIKGLYKLIDSRPDGITRYEIQKSTGWGNGIYERTMTLAKQKHPDLMYDRIKHISIIESKIRKLEK